MFHNTPAYKILKEEQKIKISQWYKDIKCWSEGNPVACPECDGINLKDKEIIQDNGIVHEYKIYCHDCNNEVSYWAHGYYINEVNISSPDEIGFNI